MLALVAGCVPIQAPAAPALTGAPTAAPAPEAADALTGDWTGSISVAGIELAVVLHVAQEGDVYSATLDIPQQNAMGLPVGNLKVALPNLTFTILDGAQQAGFVGALGDDGVITGIFSQAGQSGTFTLAQRR